MSYNVNCYAEKKDINGTPFDIGSQNHYDLQDASHAAHAGAQKDTKADVKAVAKSADAHQATKDAINESQIAKLTGSHDVAADAHSDAGKMHSKAMDAHTNTDVRLNHAKAADLHEQFSAHHDANAKDC